MRNQFILMRHGESIANCDDRISCDLIRGRVEDPLTDDGRMQVTFTCGVLKERFPSRDFVVTASPFLRTVQTALVIQKLLPVRKLSFDARLAERSWPTLQGRPSQQFRDEVWAIDRDESLPPPGAEGVNDVARRMNLLVEELDESIEDSTIILVTHCDPGRIVHALRSTGSLRNHYEGPEFPVAGFLLLPPFSAVTATVHTTNKYCASHLQNLGTPGNLLSSMRATKLSQEGRDIVRLTVGQLHVPPPPHVLEAMEVAIPKQDSHRYSPAAGIPALRASVATDLSAKYGGSIGMEDVVITLGAKGGIALVLEALLDPLDEVLLATPCWSGFIPAIVRCRAIPVLASSTDGKLKGQQLDAYITERTKVVIINNPVNPTGAVYAENEIDDLLSALARRPNVILLSDEIYEDLVFPEVDHIPTASRPSADRVVTVSGWSKSYGLTGARVGYISGPKDILSTVEKLQSAGCYPATLEQLGALAAWGDGRAFPRRMASYYAQNAALVVSNAPQLALKGLVLAVEPRGGLYAFFHLNNHLTHLDGDGMETFLLESGGVAVSSGSGFGAPWAIRISLAISQEGLSEALSRIEKCLPKSQSHSVAA